MYTKIPSIQRLCLSCDYVGWLFLDSLTWYLRRLITAACFLRCMDCPIALSMHQENGGNSLDRWIGIGAVAFSGLMLGALYLVCEYGWVHNTPREHGIIWYLTVACVAWQTQPCSCS